MNLKFLLLPMLLLTKNSAPIGFSQPEWNNPNQNGSSLWLKNGKPKPVIIAALFVRDKGFKISDEVSFSIGPTRYFFKAEKAKRGEWSRLNAQDKRRIRLRGKDSLMVRGFEYGSRLKGKGQAKAVRDEYVLDLKLIDNAGDSSIVKVSESSTKYYINSAADGNAAPAQE